jgi:hypothetical protein
MVAHPHALQVGALSGRVTLSGPVLAHEKSPLLTAVRGVWGVSGVEDLLVVHDHPESIPSLQGGIDPLASHPHDHWPPALRAAALSGGVLVALLGARQRSLAGAVIVAAGIALALRGVSNRALASLLEAPDRRDATPRGDRGADASVPEDAAAAPPPTSDASSGHALH